MINGYKINNIEINVPKQNIAAKIIYFTASIAFQLEPKIFLRFLVPQNIVCCKTHNISLKFTRWFQPGLLSQFIKFSTLIVTFLDFPIFRHIFPYFKDSIFQYLLKTDVFVKNSYH